MTIVYLMYYVAMERCKSVRLKDDLNPVPYKFHIPIHIISAPARTR
jgi:hypothetical protein